MTPTFFETQLEFRKWLEKHHQNETELMVGFYKVGSHKPSMIWSQSVDQAICFGWIDGIRKSIDSESYCIRFTPRRRSSIWSAINIKKVEALTNAGLMTEDGLKAFGYMRDDRSKEYSHESETTHFYIDYEEELKKK